VEVHTVRRLTTSLTQAFNNNDAWRVCLMLALPIPAIALLLGFMLEHPSGQATAYDAVAYPLLSSLLLIMTWLLWLNRQSLQLIVTLVMLGSCTFFFTKLFYLLFFTPDGTSVQAELTETFFWVPAVYVLSSFIPNLKGGRSIAVAFFACVLLLSLVYTVPNLVTGAALGVVYALVQINLSNLTFLALTQAFVFFKESFAKAEAHAETMQRLAHTDLLTGLPNRLHLDLVLPRLVEDVQDKQEQFALLFVDIDGFGTINDAWGHQVGDQLLRDIATRLTAYGRGNDVIARLNSDEFVLILKDTRSDLDVIAAAKTLKEALERPFSIKGQMVTVSASIGMSLCPHDGLNPTDLLRHADSAMHQVKANGKNGVKLYEATVDAEREERKTLERDLHQALRNRELELLYQPIIDLKTGRLKKVEALMRWHHPERGLIRPDIFIPLAESSGLIIGLGTWALLEACRQMRRWHLQGLTGVTVTVNVSPLQFMQADFKDMILGALEASGLEPVYLELELTETIVMRNIEGIKRLLKDIQALGVRIAMDDFGTGYSSLSYLKDLSLDTLKIDKAFVRDLGNPRKSPQYALALVNAIVTIGQALDVEIVAEGIEDEREFTHLRELGVDLGQGYYFARPIPAHELPLMFSGSTTLTWQAGRVVPSLN
jgi:diguanylate cyclase (GGDEF)-like protein